MARRAVGILISGRGSNMRALIEAAKAADFPARIALVISNKADAAGLDFAKQHGIPTQVIPSKGRTREAFDQDVDAALRAAGVELVCLAGFMRILTPGFVEGWRERMINIHPSLLPAFKGIHVHEQALAAGVKLSGCTVHFVVPGLDDGPIILQAAVPVPPDATPESLAAAILQQEHVIYPRALRWLAEGRLSVDGNTVRVKDAAAQQAAIVSPAI